MECKAKESNGLAVPAAATFQDMGIDHRPTHVRVPQQLLHRANVGARLQQVRGEAVAQ